MGSMTANDSGTDRTFHLAVAPDLSVGYEVATGRLFSVPEAHNSCRARIACTATSEPLPRKRDHERAASMPVSPETAAQTKAPALPRVPGPLDRLSLHVSHDCNMRCRYCYAGGGTYGGRSECMTPEIAGELIHRIARSAGSIGAIQFFGGEPLLAVSSMEAACAAAHRSYDEGTLSEMPAFRIVSNFSRLPAEFLDLVHRFDIEVAASCDGPQAVHDRLRPFADGSGSFETLARNIEALQKATSGRQPKGLAATYTRLHQDVGMTRADLRSFLCAKFGVAEVMVIPVRPLPGVDRSLVPRWDNPLREHAEHARSAVRSLADVQRQIDLSGLLMAPYILFPGRAACETFCPAGIRTISVTPSGDIYPCQVFMGSGEFYMGNGLCADDIEQSPHYLRVWRKLRNNLKSSVPECQECWLRRICRSCPGLMFTLNGGINQPVEEDCLLRQGLTEGTLLEVARIREDPVVWSRFVANVKKTIQAMSKGPRGGLC